MTPNIWTVLYAIIDNNNNNKLHFTLSCPCYSSIQFKIRLLV